MTSITPNRRRSSLAGLTLKTKPSVEIAINDDQQGSFTPSYTTLDKIQGTVSFTAPCDLSFEDVHITFQGHSRTYVEKVATTSPTTGRTQASHYFLRLVQPLDQSLIPADRIARAGTTYVFPFTFVVPERLLPQSCTHGSRNAQILEAHQLLPPTFGDPLTSGDGVSLKDDLAPDMTKISYGIRVIVTRRSETNNKPLIISDAMKRLRIIPAVEEEPPLSVHSGKDEDYKLRKEKDLKKGLFKGKLGKLTVEAQQPKSLRLPHLRSTEHCPITTMAVLNLRFDPAEDGSQPPKLGSLVAKLKSSTFFSSTPLNDFPNRSMHWMYDTNRGVFADTCSLSGRNVESASWTFVDPTSPSSSVPESPEMVRRASATSISAAQPVNITPPAEISATAPYYRAQVLVPITLPDSTKSFVPTFHSCLVSRVYTLDLTLSVHNSGPTVSDPSLHLKIPIQISAEPDPDNRPMISEAEAQAIAARRAFDEEWRFGAVPPSPEYSEARPVPRAPSYDESNAAGTLSQQQPLQQQLPQSQSQSQSQSRTGSTAGNGQDVLMELRRGASATSAASAATTTTPAAASSQADTRAEQGPPEYEMLSGRGGGRMSGQGLGQVRRVTYYGLGSVLRRSRLDSPFA
ncbi:hypothetical protein MMC25_004745 [Agyrium rufum]|nr:hypothetical protein [Agyrium rufum]